MMGGIKKITVVPGKETEFEETFNLLKAQVKRNETGNVYYDLYRSLTEPGQYIVMERYYDRSAVNEHKNSTHGQKYFPDIKALLEKLDVEYFESVD